MTSKLSIEMLEQLEIGAILFSVGWYLFYNDILDNKDFGDDYFYFPFIGIGLSALNGKN
jgi:hypothetical protein